MSKSKRVKRKVGGGPAKWVDADDSGLLDPKDVPLLNNSKFKPWGVDNFSSAMELSNHKRMRQVERDVASLQIELQAMGERLDMVEAENKALRAMWGGTTHSGVPYWADMPREPWGGPKVWATTTTGTGTEWR